MTIKELEIFIELSCDCSVSESAKRLGLSQSAVSLSVKSLEKKLSEQLFDRIGKKLVLNERGRYFKTLILPHLKGLKEARSIFKKELVAGEIYIASSRTIGDYIMPLIMCEFMEQYKDVKISNTTTNSKAILEMVKSGKVDMGFVEYHIEDKDIVSEKLCNDELVVVGRERDFLRKEFFIDELTYKTWLFRERGSGTRETFFDYLNGVDIEFPKSMELLSFESIKTLLLSNPHTVTCISKKCVQNELKNGDLFKANIKNISFKRDFYLIYHKKREKNRVFLEFSSFCGKYFIDT